VEGAPTNVDGTVVMKTVTKNPLSRRVIDVEFQRVSMTEKVTVEIPVKFVGDAKGIVEGGVVEEAMNELHVRALPGTLPAFIEVDITDLELGGHISVSNLVLPEGVEVLNDLDTTLVACVYPFKGGAKTEDKTEAPAATE
jgi:large subunit ribosomal protein L25